MKKYLYLLLLFVFFLPVGVLAEDGTDKLYIDIRINDDGSLFVRELASLEGSYNGRLRTIDYRNMNAKKFTGIPSDFGGSDIYNGRGITDVKVYDVLDRYNITFESLDNLSYEYQEVSNAYDGAYGVYILNNTMSGIDLKIFNPSSNNRAFYIEYKVLDAVVVHRDVAELAWNILGDSYQENIQDMIVKVHLPKNNVPDDKIPMKVWGHGPLNGIVNRTSEDTATITYDFLGAYNPVDIRMVFDPDLVKNATKKTNVDAMEYILDYEEEKAMEANREREKIIAQNNLIRGITVVWYIVLIAMIIYTYFKYDREIKTKFNMKYHREFPDTYGPEILEYLLKKNVTSLSFSASILQIISKKALKVEEIVGKKKEYKFIKVEENMKNLTSLETSVVTLLVNDIGNGKEVTLKEIKNYGKNLTKAKKFMSSYNDWISDVKIKGEEQQFYNTSGKVKVLGIIISSMGAIWITVLNFMFDTQFFLGSVALIVGILATIYFITFKKRTEKGALHYAKWMAFKRFLLDFGRMDEKELPEINLWEKYLVYAAVLGCAKEVEKQMRIKIEHMNTLDPTYVSFSDYYLMHSLIHSDIASTVSNTINQAVASSRSSIAASQSSSSSGFGGGMSSGGGSFGGGGGGGRF